MRPGTGVLATAFVAGLAIAAQCLAQDACLEAPKVAAAPAVRVQIDLKPRMLSLRYPMEVALHGDARETLRELLPLLEYKQDRSFRKAIEDEVAAWWTTLEERAMVSAKPINPQRLFWELSPRLPDRCVLTADSGSCAMVMPAEPLMALIPSVPSLAVPERMIPTACSRWSSASERKK